MDLEELKEIIEKTEFKSTHFDCFIETGSYLGDTINNLKDFFNKLITIEITELYYNHCKNRFVDFDKIDVIKNDSIFGLPTVINKNLDKNIIFFLDGHYSAGNTGIGQVEVPLFEEITIINDLYKKPCIIIIDDADLFNYKDHNINWIGINEEKLLKISSRITNSFYVKTKIWEDKKRLVLVLN